jgi:cytochrome c oxidase subunit 2
LYRVCAACHGDNAEGHVDTRAPRLAGQFEWYLAQQLRNFREGLRGTTPGDQNGAVMKPMADALPDDQAVDDVVAYIMSKNPRRYRYRR